MQGTIKKFKGNLEETLGEQVNVGLWNLAIGLRNVENGFWNLDCDTWRLYSETCRSYCEICIVKLGNRIVKLCRGDCETLTPDCETLKRDFETQKSDHETPCWDSESPCRRNSYHVENNRKYQSDLQVPQAEVDTCMLCRSWKNKNPIVHTQGQFQFWWGWEFWYLLSYHCTHSMSNSNAMRWEFVKKKSLPLYTFKVNRVGNFDIF